LGIDLSLDGHSLLEAPLYLLTGTPPAEIAASPRIGISVGRELLLRFYEVGNSHISRQPRH
ncbi:MAG TPA: 3-methyladenine DNA glycosylase, partial [Firmicutes bacterium]|nr:3-methyladenine DNA glycosylase [Bacillota bacterium]